MVMLGAVGSQLGQFIKRKQVEKAIAGKVSLGKPVKHLLEILARDYGLERLAAAVKKPLASMNSCIRNPCVQAWKTKSPLVWLTS